MNDRLTHLYRYTRALSAAALLVLALAGTAQAQSKRGVEHEPGYIDLADVEDWFDASPTLEVNIKGALLRMVAEASRLEDPDLADLLFQLRAIQMRGFSLRRSQYADVERRAERLGHHLEDQGWETVMRIRDEDERVDMYMKTHRGEIAGLMVMVIEPGQEESVFINIVGDIDPEQIGRLGRKFNLGRHFDNW